MKAPASLAAIPLLLGALVPAPRAAAGDGTAAALQRFAEKWSDGVDAMKPEEVDAHRASLLEPVAAAATPEALDALLRVALERAEQAGRFRERLKALDERDRARAEEAKEAERTGKKPPGPSGVDEARIRYEEDRKAAEDREKFPPRLAREERWQPRLASAAGALADALPDPDFARASPRLREAMGEAAEGWDGWMAAALGASRKERTARLLLDAAGDALGEYRKALAARVRPAKDLDRVNQEIADRVVKYLEQARKQGDDSGLVPVSLVENLEKEKAGLDAEVSRLTGAMQTADHRRRAARRALGAMLAGSPEDLRGRLLDLLEKECLANRDFEARSFGLGALAPCPGDRAMKSLREAARDPQPDVVVTALEALGTRGEAEAVEILAAGLSDGRWQVRAAAALALGATGRAAAVPPLLAALAKADGRTVDDLRAALVELTGRDLPPVAAAWEAWWAKEGESFRGPRDPGGAEAAKGKEEGTGEGRPPEKAGNQVSFYGIRTASQRILFVVDFSGSMAFPGSATDARKRKVDVLHEELRKSLDGLPDGSRFGIVGFASDVRVWKKGGAVRDAKTAKEAMDWVERQKVVGSTNIYDALETAFRLMGVGAAADRNYQPAYDTVFFMTDGVPTSGKVTDKAVILGEVRRWNEGRRVRLHVIGAGGKAKAPGARPAGVEDVDQDFLRKLAAENDGECVFR